MPAPARGVAPRAPRTIDAWAERRVGKAVDEITISDVQRSIPPATGLRYGSKPSTRSPLGGRIASHLRHLEEGEIIERLERAETFLAETSTV